jgi:hypothetical protein
MPLAFATILAGLDHAHRHVDESRGERIAHAYKLAPMGMFELAPVGIPITLAGLSYMMTLGRRMIPDRFKRGGNQRRRREHARLSGQKSSSCRKVS